MEDVRFAVVNNTKSLEEGLSSFKEGLVKEEPAVLVTAKAYLEDEDGKPSVKVILSKEVVDLDGEVVVIDGIELPENKSLPFIDAHMSWGSVTETILGRVANLAKGVDKEGIKVLTGDVNFAPTPKGVIAESLYKGGYATDVSIGFIVKDYDAATRRITKCMVYELSGVIVGANPHAKVQKSLAIEELEKSLQHYKDIKPKVKEYRRFFLSDEFCAALGYEKVEDELINIKNIHDLIVTKLTVAKAEVETQPSKPVSETPKVVKMRKSELVKIVQAALDKAV